MKTKSKQKQLHVYTHDQKGENYMKLEIIAYTFDMGQCSAFQVTINFFISQSGRHNFLNSLRNMMSLQQVSCNWLSL